MAKKQVVIIGGGFGGLEVAKGLSNSEYDVYLVDRTNHHLFQPLLYQVATAALAPRDIAYPIREIFKNSSNITVLMKEVAAIDKNLKQILFVDQEILRYDYLVVATGARHSYFGHPEWETFAPGLKTLPDALTIRSKLLRAYEKAEESASLLKKKIPLNFVIIGGGPTGVELAGAMAEIAHKTMRKNFRNIDPASSKVLLIEGEQRILNMYPEVLSMRAKKDLERMGVEIVLGLHVENVDGHSVQMKGRSIETDTVFWAAGNQASSLLRTLEVPLDRYGRLEVQRDLTVFGSDDLFVIGDCASFTTAEGETLPGLATVAIQEGRYVARALLKKIKQKDRPAFVFNDKGSMATIGRASAVAVIRGRNYQGWFAWLIWAIIHIYSLIGFRNRIFVMIEWIVWYVSGQRGSRLLY